MLKPKKKISKREIKEDRLVTTYFEAQSWFEVNRKRLGTIFTGVLIAAVAVWFYYNNLSTQNRAATADLGNILRYYDQAQYETAINGSPRENLRGLKQIVDEYGGTSSGKLAAFYLGNSYFALREYEKALEYYKEARVSDPSIMASVTAGIAACHETQANYVEAARTFERAAKDDEMKLHSAEYLYRAAQNYMMAGEPKKAEDILKSLKANYSQSPYAREADRLLVRASS
ncbi:MAG: tetratricopeptide repeat protein [Ignavibacteriales bacterium]|nr:tetratricopeptide repeat protein [Ignavibacteriales bacterium]